ncbi:MAG: CPBP family intramembrane metalloprotease, partial [Candidatus Uhrbacteria bacterium]|nr:CPBP family intramembrane metalloprotease [Candidatus Uhrbacteria bacterium]
MSRSFLWWIVLATALFQLVGTLFYFVILDNATLIQLTYAATKIVMLGIPLLMVSLGLKLPSFTLKPQLKLSLMYGAGSGLVIGALILTILALFPSISDVFTEPVVRKIQEVGISSIAIYWIAAIGISTVHSFFEEYYWRWYVVKGLETRLSPLASLLLGNFFFACHHYIVLSQFVTLPLTILFGTLVGIGGCLWSWIYRRTGSLLGGWVSHVLIDLAIFAVGYLL